MELDTAIIGGVGIEKLPGSCKGRLGVWLHEDLQCNPEDEEEEKEEDSMWRMINVEEDEDDSTYEVMDLPKTFVHAYDRDPEGKRSVVARICTVAMRDIQVGEEMTANYGRTYWCPKPQSP